MALGVVAIVAGAVSVFMGVAGTVGGGPASATVDSELRYYAAWYVGAGVLILWNARRVESARLAVRVVCGALFLGGCGRVISLLVVGRPHWTATALMVLELGLPLVLVPWQASLARRSAETSLGPG